MKPYDGQITYGGNWFISSNLPYTQRAAFDPYNGRRVVVIGSPELRTTCPRMHLAFFSGSWTRSNELSTNPRPH